MRCGPYMQLFNVRTPHQISADLASFASAHTGFADLNAAFFFGSTSLTPLDNGAGEFSEPKKC